MENGKTNYLVRTLAGCFITAIILPRNGIKYMMYFMYSPKISFKSPQISPKGRKGSYRIPGLELLDLGLPA